MANSKTEYRRLFLQADELGVDTSTAGSNYNISFENRVVLFENFSSEERALASVG